MGRCSCGSGRVLDGRDARQGAGRPGRWAGTGAARKGAGRQVRRAGTGAAR
ncbi:MAG: hypothetical protein LIO85_07390 [Rikenellaceae bacterium]|nr:hypothetical protein [Rikenellaceae bacterium]